MGPGMNDVVAIDEEVFLKEGSHVMFIGRVHRKWTK